MLYPLPPAVQRGLGRRPILLIHQKRVQKSKEKLFSKGTGQANFL